ncbi:hypothetical protein Nhal_1856 [Nitrosococcus halophilus Nc 4]|uniref:Uncharacterized protein n=1 Tax=Nitrosococcus halophilus (strain Nc4) TaxID=472759 RepID=D5C366_NITHN|nr:hypothetical protein [Nitrosococcus halophilus]ADE14958.1 hypothetical protein Nhal_1837 [Nitrosococcus halophilus Nc 4]ADE14974.1 hypothetical protein Nhal_1856 [Nitrosococcus halophilus Nc 4]
MTREGRVGFFDTRREVEVMYQRYRCKQAMVFPNRNGDEKRQA